MGSICNIFLANILSRELSYIAMSPGWKKMRSLQGSCKIFFQGLAR